MTESLLEVRNLTVSFQTPDGIVEAVRGISFNVERGETLGIVGESGSGKSVATQTVAGLTRGARISGEAIFEGRDLLTMSAAELRAIRGPGIAMIFQNPLSSLHPFYKIGWQIEEMIRAHETASRAAARKRAIELLGLVGIPRPEKRVDDYPHQFSGGMLQRAMIAMALALQPRLLIADEPTTALDVTVQAQIVRLMQRLQNEFGMAMIMITHDLGVIAGMANEVVVMYAGQIMEQASRYGLFQQPSHPYTNGLLRSLPRMNAPDEPLTAIAGQPPSLIEPPSGCPFHPRCPQVMDRCTISAPPFLPVTGPEAHRSACWLLDPASKAQE
ncbi:MAG TPA: ABC transporter ATP-binding protein [Terriglobia bacterium]|nr:ABC transporter ATP-binding protein [Terriglobia bacterium]